MCICPRFWICKMAKTSNWTTTIVTGQNGNTANRTVGTFAYQKDIVCWNSKNRKKRENSTLLANERKCFSKFYCFHLGITRQIRMYHACTLSLRPYTVYCVLCLIVCDFTRAVCISSFRFCIMFTVLCGVYARHVCASEWMNEWVSVSSEPPIIFTQCDS